MPPFQVLLMRDPSRFSRRDGDEAFGELKAIARAGVQIHFYGDGSTFEYGTLATNVVGFLRSEIAADYRRQIAALTAETMLRKAPRGSRDRRARLRLRHRHRQHAQGTPGEPR